MSENMKEATKFIEQGHVRVGPQVVKDPAFLVNRALEDFVTWVDGSAIKRHVMEYNDLVSNDDMMFPKSLVLWGSCHNKYISLFCTHLLFCE